MPKSVVSADQKRITQEDPIGFNGSSNLYAYADGGPLEGTDPSGLMTNWDQRSRDFAAQSAWDNEFIQGMGFGSNSLASSVIEACWQAQLGEGLHILDLGLQREDARHIKEAWAALRSSTLIEPLQVIGPAPAQTYYGGTQITAIVFFGGSIEYGRAGTSSGTTFPYIKLGVGAGWGVGVTSGGGIVSSNSFLGSSREASMNVGPLSGSMSFSNGNSNGFAGGLGVGVPLTPVGAAIQSTYTFTFSHQDLMTWVRFFLVRP